MDSLLRDLLLLGIGAATYSYEKAAGLVEELVKKGELTMGQGRELSEELKRRLDLKVMIARVAGGTAAQADSVQAMRSDLEEIKERLRRIEEKFV